MTNKSAFWTTCGPQLSLGALGLALLSLFVSVAVRFDYADMGAAVPRWVSPGLLVLALLPLSLGLAVLTALLLRLRGRHPRLLAAAEYNDSGFFIF